jgi:hypothetical protein
MIEVSYSQKWKSLIDLIENYLLALNNGIKVMVKLDLKYKKLKEVNILI